MFVACTTAVPASKVDAKLALACVQLDHPTFWDRTLPSQTVHLVPVGEHTAEWNDVVAQSQGCMAGRVRPSVLQSPRDCFDSRGVGLTEPDG